MSEHRASVDWKLETESFAYTDYNRDHVWRFDGGVEVAASAAPDFLGSAQRVDPEEAFVASLSSCHMLTFLALAAKRRWIVERYQDAAVGHMEKNDRGLVAITRVELRPRVGFRGDSPGADELARLHDQAHHHCFIANSVKTDVVVVAHP